MMPARAAAMTRSGPETRNIGAAITGSASFSRSLLANIESPNRSGMISSQRTVSTSIDLWVEISSYGSNIFACQKGGAKMGAHNGLTIASQTLRALRRYPDRDAFVWESAKLSYAGAIDLIGRMQAVFARNNFRRADRVALLSENSAESWCAGVAAQGLGLS